MEAAIHAFFAANPVTRGILVGFFTAVGVDLHAWQAADAAPFNLKKALVRWVYGAFIGAGFGAV